MNAAGGNAGAAGAKLWPSRSPAGGPGADPVRILVRSPNPLGDACLSMPAVRALKRAGPRIHLAVCCRENLAPLWEAREEVDQVLGFPRAANPAAVGRRIRAAGPFDFGVLLPNSFRSALELRLGGVRRLAGYARHGRRPLLRLSVGEPEGDADDDEQSRHHAHRYLHLAAGTGADVSSLDELLAMPPAPSPIESGATEIHLGVCPGAEYGDAKRYPVERYAEAVESLRRRRPNTTVRVSLFGSPAERALAEELAASLAQPCHNRAGETSVGGLVEELRACHLLATNDTGTMHLAAALGVPTVAIFGSTDPSLTAPLGTGHRVIRHPVHCSPCFLRECPIDYRCMMRIEPDAVVREMEALLDSAEAVS